MLVRLCQGKQRRCEEIHCSDLQLSGCYNPRLALLAGLSSEDMQQGEATWVHSEATLQIDFGINGTTLLVRNISNTCDYFATTR